jgi:hypothetical protein
VSVEDKEEFGCVIEIDCEWMSGILKQIVSDSARKSPGESHFVRGIGSIIKTSHQGIELLLVAYVGDCLHIWKVAKNTFNKQSQTADKGRSSY